MKMRGLITIGIAGMFAAASAAAKTEVPAAIATDPANDRQHPAAMAVVHVPTHGVEINGVLYEAAGAGLHPTLVLLHGFPGNEQNLDLAQAVRRDGWNVLTLHYRGSWGSPGQFSFAHVFEDAQAAVDFVRSPAVAARYAIDLNRIVVIGHSMGGMAAAIVGMHDPRLAGVGMISAANFGMIGTVHTAKEKSDLVGFMSDSMESLSGTSPQRLADEAADNASKWDFVAYAPTLGLHPLLIVTSDDGLAVSNDALAKAVQASGKGKVTTLHLATDHSYSDKRIALEAAIIDWLDLLPVPTVH